MMAGKSHPKTGAKLTVFSNYEQYGLQWPVGLVRMDVHRHPFRTGLTEVSREGGCRVDAGTGMHSNSVTQCAVQTVCTVCIDIAW